MIEVKGDLKEFIMNATGENLSKIQRKSMRAGAKLIYNQAKSNFKTRLPAATHQGPVYYLSGQRIVGKDRLIDAVKMRVYETEDHEYEFKVHAMGTRSKNSSTWLARMFSVGTKERANRGRIEANKFFEDAVTTQGQHALDKIEETFLNEIKL